MIALDEQHTSKNLAIEVKKCIEKFEIALKQMRSFITDKAGNVVGIVDCLVDDDKLYAIEEEEEDGALSIIEEIENNQIDNGSFGEEETRTMALQIMSEDALHEYLDERDEYEESLKEVMEDLPHHIKENTFNVRSGCHVSHLIVRGALKMSNMYELVTVCRKVAKLLRRDEYVRMTRRRNLEYKQPRLYVDAKWDSDCTKVIVLFCHTY